MHICRPPFRSRRCTPISSSHFRLPMRWHAKSAASCLSLAVLLVSPVLSAICDSISVTDPVSLRDSTGWDSQDFGAGQRRQGHVSAEVTVWGQKHIVVFGGTNLRTDGVNNVYAQESSVSIMDITNPQNWTELEMVGESPQLQIYLPWRRLEKEKAFYVVDRRSNGAKSAAGGLVVEITWPTTTSDPVVQTF